MQISKRKVNASLRNQIRGLLAQVIVDIKNIEEARLFLTGLFSEEELETISKRLGIAYFLDKGKSYQSIKENLAVSSTTVAAVARDLKKKKGFRLILEKIHAEEWADRWSKKLTGMMRFRRK